MTVSMKSGNVKMYEPWLFQSGHDMECFEDLTEFCITVTFALSFPDHTITR